MGSHPGAPSKLERRSPPRTEKAEVVEARPGPGGRRRRAAGGARTWRRGGSRGLRRAVRNISLDETTVGRELKALGFAKISARPRHYAPSGSETSWPSRLLKKTSARRRSGEDPGGRPPERRRDSPLVVAKMKPGSVGQKNKLITPTWHRPRRGHARPRGRHPQFQRTEWSRTILYPLRRDLSPRDLQGKGAGLVMRRLVRHRRSIGTAHLASRSVPPSIPGAHAVLIARSGAVGT